MSQAKADKRIGEHAPMLPEMIVDFECDEDLLYMVVANVGLSSAHHISIQCNKEIKDFRGKPVTEMPLLRRLGFMPPGKKIRLFVDRFSAYAKARQPMQLSFSVTYSDRQGRQQTDVIKHDLAIFKGIITSIEKSEY
jgi:hypothetical protein